MRLNSALVYSFLFVSAVLADSHPEKQQPPFLNHVEKSIDLTTVTPPEHKWAGAAWTRPSEACFLLIATDFAAGWFIVPSAKGPIGSGFNIAVGMSDSIGGFVFGVGITVKIVEGGVSYEAWSKWLPTRIIAPAWFPISVGHEIGAMVQQYSRTSGVVALINFNTGTVWASFVSGNILLSPQDSDADWVITTLPNDIPTLPDVSLPNFHGVTFADIQAHIDGGYNVPNHKQAITSEIVQDGRTVTDSSTFASAVTIKYNLI